MDDSTLKAAFAAHAEGAGKFTRRSAIALADMAGVMINATQPNNSRSWLRRVFG